MRQWFATWTRSLVLLLRAGVCWCVRSSRSVCPDTQSMEVCRWFLLQCSRYVRACAMDCSGGLPFTPLSRTALMTVDGMPHRPKPPTSLHNQHTTNSMLAQPTWQTPRSVHPSMLWCSTSELTVSVHLSAPPLATPRLHCRTLSQLEHEKL